MGRQAEAAESAEKLIENERIAAQTADVEAVLTRAGGDPRLAVRALLVELDEMSRAQAWAEKASSLGYRRLRQPPPPAAEVER